MCKKLLTSLVGLGLFVSASASYAGGDSGSRSLKSVVAHPKFIYIEPTSVFNNPDNCGESNLVFLDLTHEASRYVYASAMTALTANKNITMWLDGCATSDWGQTYPKVVTLTVVK